MPANANDVRRRASQLGAAAAPVMLLAQALPKPDANAASRGGSALAVARERGNVRTVRRRQSLEPPSREWVGSSAYPFPRKSPPSGQAWTHRPSLGHHSSSPKIWRGIASPTSPTKRWTRWHYSNRLPRHRRTRGGPAP